MTKRCIIFIGLTLLLAIPVLAQDVTGAMLGLVNAERIANGVSPLNYNPQLALAAQNHSNDMAQMNNLNHQGSDGSFVRSRMLVANYDGGDFAENIAVQNNDDVFRAYEQWFGSEGHRNNMMSPRFTDVGIAMAVSATGDYYFTMVLGTPKPALEDLIFTPTEEVEQPTEEVAQPTEEVAQPTEEVTQPTEEVVQPTEEVVQPTEEVVQPTEEVVQPTEEVVQPTEEVVQPTEEIVQPTEEVVQSEPNLDRPFSATFSAEPLPGTQVTLSTGPFQPNPFTSVRFEVSYADVIVASLDATPDIDGVARVPFVGTEEVGTYTVQAFLTSQTVTNQLISSGQFVVREEITDQDNTDEGVIDDTQPLTSAFDGLDLQLTLPEPAIEGSLVSMSMGPFPTANVPFVEFIVSYEGQAIAQIIGDIDDIGVATANFWDTALAGNYAVQVWFSDDVRDTERSGFYSFVIVSEETPQDTTTEQETTTENNGTDVNEAQTATFRSLDISAPFFDLVNEIRAEAGVRPVGYDARLLSAAQQHNDDMIINGNFSHTGSDGSDVSLRVEQHNYQWGAVAENILIRSDLSVQGAFDQWFNSAGHRANMLNGDNVHMAVAYGQADDGSYYFTMVLGRPIDYVAPVAPVAPPVVTVDDEPLATEEAVDEEPVATEETVDVVPTLNAIFVNDRLTFSASNVPHERVQFEILCQGNVLYQDGWFNIENQRSWTMDFIIARRALYKNQGCELEIRLLPYPHSEEIIARTNVTVPTWDSLFYNLPTFNIVSPEEPEDYQGWYTLAFVGNTITINADYLVPNDLYTLHYQYVFSEDTSVEFNPDAGFREVVSANNNGEIHQQHTIVEALTSPGIESMDFGGVIAIFILDSSGNPITRDSASLFGGRVLLGGYILVITQEIWDQQTETAEPVAPEIAMNLTLDSDTGEIQAQVDFLDEARNGETLVATISCEGEALGEVQLPQRSASETFTASPEFVFIDNVGCDLEVSVAYANDRDTILATATATVEHLSYTPYIGLAIAELSDTIVSRGDTLEVILRDLAPNETINMVLESGNDPDTATRFNLESVTADAEGFATWTVTIPQDVLDGTLLVLGSNATDVIINDQVLVEPSPNDILDDEAEDDEVLEDGELTLEIQLNNLTGRMEVTVVGFAPDDEEDRDIVISVSCEDQIVRQYNEMKHNGAIDIEELYDMSLFEDHAGCQATFTVAYTDAPDVVIAETQALINQPNFMQGTRVTVEPQVVIAGESITVSVMDRFGDMSRIAVSYIFNEIYGENAQADGNNQFTWTTTIPEDFAPGSYNIIALDEDDEFLFGANFTVLAPPVIVGEAPQPVADGLPDDVDLDGERANDVQITVSPTQVTRGGMVDLMASNLIPGQLISTQLIFGDEVVATAPPAPADVNGVLRQVAEMLETDPFGEYLVVLLDENEFPIAVASFELVEGALPTGDADNTLTTTDENTDTGNNTNTNNTVDAELPQPVAAVRSNSASESQEIEGVNVIVVTQPPRVGSLPIQVPANQVVVPIAPIDPSLPPPDIELYWDVSSFTLFNVANRTLDISELSFTSELGNLNIDRWDVDGLSSALETFASAGCLQAFPLSQSFLPEAPEYCQQRHGWLLVGEQNQFWNPLREFTVLLGQNEIAVCTISPCRIRLTDDLVNDVPSVSTPHPVATGANVRLTYDDTNFLIRNIADTPIILAGIVFQSDTVSFSISEWETEFMRADLFAFPSQDCLQTWDINIFELPTPELCNFRQGWITVNPNEKFWTTANEFTVFQYGTPIATCSVIAGVCNITVDN